MATTAITCPLMVVNVLSADLDLPAADGVANAIAATTPSDGWVISPPSGSSFGDGDRLLIGLNYGATEAVIIKAGVRYPAQRADLGDLSLAGTSGDVRFVVVEASRFMQTNGTIKVTGINASGALMALMLPKGA